MEGEKVPRRMRRFYRQKEASNEAYESGTGGTAAQSAARYSNYDRPNYEEPVVDRSVLAQIPSMEYEDVKIDQKNAQELKKIEEQNMEEKLALIEVERFKKENKRLPNKHEHEQIAENIFTQLKGMSAEGVAEQKDEQRASTSRRMRRGRAQLEKENPLAQKQIPAEGKIQKEPSFQSGPAAAPIANIKDLLKDDASIGAGSGSSLDKEFDLGFEGSEGSEDKSAGPESIESLEETGDLDLKEMKGMGEVCPNCKKESEKIIYCPKCGTAYCENCAKSKQGNEYTCPKCGAKTKV